MSRLVLAGVVDALIDKSLSARIFLLFQRNAKRFGGSRKRDDGVVVLLSLLHLLLDVFGLLCRVLFDPFLAFFGTAPTCKHHLLLVEGRDKVVPLFDDGDAFLELDGRFLEEMIVDLLQNFLDVVDEVFVVVDLELLFLGWLVSSGNDERVGFDVVWTDFELERNSFDFPLVELEAWVVVLGVIDLHTDAGLL